MVRYVSQNALFPVEAARPLSFVVSWHFSNCQLFPLVNGHDWQVTTVGEVLVNPLVVGDLASVRQLAGHRYRACFVR